MCACVYVYLCLGIVGFQLTFSQFPNAGCEICQSIECFMAKLTGAQRWQHAAQVATRCGKPQAELETKTETELETETETESERSTSQAKPSQRDHH